MEAFSGGDGKVALRKFRAMALVLILSAAATGSAAGPLAIHLARHDRIRFGEQIEIRQGAQIGRPSLLYATATGDGDRIDSVEVGGAAVIVAEGRFRTALAKTNQ